MKPFRGLPYKHLGNFNAAPDWAAMTLRCDVCRVEWIGCWDNATCPQCGNHDDWDRQMEDRKALTDAAINLPFGEQLERAAKFAQSIPPEVGREMRASVASHFREQQRQLRNQ